MNKTPTPDVGIRMYWTPKGMKVWDGKTNVGQRTLVYYGTEYEPLKRELTTTSEQLLESESARNRNFQSASRALETVAKLSAKLETCTLQTEQYSRIMLKALAELANKTANLAHADTKIGELQDFIKTQSAELAKVKAEEDNAYERISWLEGQREIECQQKENALAESEACLKEVEQLRTELSRLRGENAAKDAKFREINALGVRVTETGDLEDYWSRVQCISHFAPTSNPPVCVPVEVVAG